MFSLLAIDAGNSFLKWCYYEHNRCRYRNRVSNQNIVNLSDDWMSLKQPDMIIISCVTSRLIRNQLAKLLDIWDIEPFWISALPQQCGVTNSYNIPEQLGSDRWSALIAAWNKYHQSSLVVNIGTAMTVDILSDDGVFLGGIIVPGPSLMQDALKLNTQIDCFAAPLRYEVFPIATGSAVYSGVIHALTGAIERIRRLFYRSFGYSVRKCILSGGGVTHIIPFLDFQYTVIDDLVLEGLVTIATDMQSNKSD